MVYSRKEQRTLLEGIGSSVRGPEWTLGLRPRPVGRCSGGQKEEGYFRPLAISTSISIANGPSELEPRTS